MIHSNAEESIKTKLKSFPKCYKTLAKKIGLKYLSPEKYYYCKKNHLIGPIKAHQFMSSDNFSCEQNCSSIIPRQINENYSCHLSIRERLKYILPMIWQHLRFPSDDCQPSEQLHDVTDGEAYKKIGRPNQLVLQLCWDGVSVFDGKKSVWPVIILISELPYSLREKFALLVGLYFGQKSPNQMMIKPICDEILLSEKKPITFNVNINDKFEKKQVTLKFLTAICDAPARAKILCLRSHNSKLGCTVCLAHTRNINDLQNTRNIKLRGNSDWRKKAVEASEFFANFTGSINHFSSIAFTKFDNITGYSPLLDFKYLNMTIASGPDIMHTVFLGLVKWIIDPFLKGDSSEVRNWIQNFDKKMNTFKFPSSICRQMPNTIKMKLKAIQYENILFYGTFFFQNLISKEQFSTLELLCFFISSLCSRELTRSEIPELQKVAHILTEEIYSRFKSTSFSTNIHYLVHLPMFAEQYGCLLVTSAYQSESIMGKISNPPSPKL